MLTLVEHQNLCLLLQKFRLRYPGRSVYQIINDAREFSKPFMRGTMSARQEYEVLTKYATHD